jgi:hypothetical protein
MASAQDEIHNALLAIYSRLNTIEGKVTLVARADRDRILGVLEEVVKRNPLIGQIYLLLDGRRNQRDILAELKRFGIETSEPTVSRRVSDMSTEYGLADLVQGGSAKVFRKNREMEDVLNLSKRIREWLEREHRVVPEPQRTRSLGKR